MITPVAQGPDAVDNLSHVALTWDVKKLELVLIPEKMLLIFHSCCTAMQH